MSTNKMREALEAARQFIVNGIEYGYILMPDRNTPDSAHDTLPMIDAALAADDAVRGTMRETFDAVLAEVRRVAPGVDTVDLLDKVADYGEACAQASRAAAPQDEAGRHNFELIEHITNWLLARDALLAERTEEVDGPMAPAMNIIDSFVAMGRAAPQSVSKVASGPVVSRDSSGRQWVDEPQSVEPALYWPEFPPFLPWISANDLHSLQEWAQTVRRDAFAAGMQRAAQQSAEPDGTLHADGYFTWTAGRRPAYMLDRGLPCKFYLAPPSAPTDAAWRAENERLRVALRFYARGEHYNLDESEEFDTVSGEPENWLCSGLEDSATMIETGRVALSALQGVELSWLDGDEDCTPQPVEGEKALRAHLSTRPAQAEELIACSERLPNPDSGEVLVWLWESKMYAIDEWHTHREDPTGMGGPTLDMGLMWRNFDFDEVSHWRPLPAPPTKTKEPGA